MAVSARRLQRQRRQQGAERDAGEDQRLGAQAESAPAHHGEHQGRDGDQQSAEGQQDGLRGRSRDLLARRQRRVVRRVRRRVGQVLPGAQPGQQVVAVQQQGVPLGVQTGEREGHLPEGGRVLAEQREAALRAAGDGRGPQGRSTARAGG